MTEKLRIIKQGDAFIELKPSPCFRNLLISQIFIFRHLICGPAGREIPFIPGPRWERIHLSDISFSFIQWKAHLPRNFFGLFFLSCTCRLQKDSVGEMPPLQDEPFVS